MLVQMAKEVCYVPPYFVCLCSFFLFWHNWACFQFLSSQWMSDTHTHTFECVTYTLGGMILFKQRGGQQCLWAFLGHRVVSQNCHCCFFLLQILSLPLSLFFLSPLTACLSLWCHVLPKSSNVNFVDWQWAPPLTEVGLCLRTSASSPHLVSLALADKSYTLVCSSWHWCLLARQPAAYPGPLEALSVPSLPSEAERSGHRLQASGSLKSSCLCEPGAHLHAWHCQGHIRWRRGKVWSVGRFIMGQLFACWRGSSDAAPGHPRLQFKKLTRTYFGSWIGFALLERSMLFLASSCWIGKGQVHEIRASLCLCPSVVIWDKCKVFVRNVQSVSILGKNWYT